MNRPPSGAIAALLFATLLPQAAPAQQAFPPLEAQALELKSQGRYAEAARPFLELLQSRPDDPLQAARAEYYAVYAHNLLSRVRDPQLYSTFAELGARRDLAVWPGLRDRLRHLAQDAARRQGRRAAVERHSRELEYLSDYWVLGPFENERGAALRGRHEPARGFDPDQAFDGKRGPQRWRQLPAPVEDGQLRLDAVMRPTQQVAAYAACALLSDSPRAATLHLGSSCAWRVFLNGEAIAGADVARGFATDQDRVQLPLRQGANLLVFLLAVEEGPFRFAARVPGVRGSSDLEDLLAAAAQQPGASTPTPATTGAETNAREVLARSEDPTDLYRLALLTAADQAEDRSERRAQQVAEQASAALPEDNAARNLLAFTRIRIGARSEEVAESARRQDYAAILARDPNHAEALRSLAELDLRNVGRAESAERLLRRALEVHPDFRAARFLQAEVLDRMGLDPLADRALEQAAQPDPEGRIYADAARAWCDRLRAQGRHTEALAVVDRLLTVDAGTEYRLLRARILLELGQVADGITELEGVIEADAYSAAPYRMLTQLQQAREEYAQAQSCLGRWLAICPEDDEALVTLAHLQGLSGEDELQVEALRQAITLNPNRKVQSRYLQFLESSEQPFYADLRRDAAQVLAADSGPPEESLAANDSHQVILRNEVVRAYRNGTTSRFSQVLVRVLTEFGARTFSEYAVGHFRGEQRARIVLAAVHKPDGTTRRPRVRGWYVKFPNLTPGDVVELQTRVDDLAPSFFGDYFGLEHQFASENGVAVRESRLTLLLDGGRDYRIQRSNGAPEAEVQTLADGIEQRVYVMNDLPSAPPEMRQPDLQESEPLIRVTTYADWQEFGRWWWDLIRRQSTVSPAMRARLAELTEGLESDAEKIDAVYNFVTTDIRYKAWEFGVHGYKPYDTEVIYERRHGDCKDKALLLNAMLAELDIEAYPVLIHANPLRSRDDLSLPLVQHFNHCISYLPATADRPGMFLDGTATFHPSDTLPEMDAGAEVLVVRPDGVDLLQVPWTDPRHNVDAQEWVVDLAADGSARVTLEQKPNGNQAVGMRSFLANEPGMRVKNVEGELTRLFSGAKVSDLEASDPLDLGAALELQVEFEVPGLVTVEQGRLLLRSRLRPSTLQGMTSDSTRRRALLIGVPAGERHRIRYRLPEGFAPTELPEPVELENSLARYRLRWSYQDGELVVDRELEIKAQRVPPEEYPEFREFTILVDQAEQQVVLARREN